MFINNSTFFKKKKYINISEILFTLNTFIIKYYITIFNLPIVLAIMSIDCKYIFLI